MHCFVTACFVLVSTLGRNYILAFIQCPAVAGRLLGATKSREGTNRKDYENQCGDGEAADYTGKFFHCCHGIVDLVTRECHGHCRDVGGNLDDKKTSSYTSGVRQRNFVKRKVPHCAADVLDEEYKKLRLSTVANDRAQTYDNGYPYYAPPLERRYPGYAWMPPRRRHWGRYGLEERPFYRQYHQTPDQLDLWTPRRQSEDSRLAEYEEDLIREHLRRSRLLRQGKQQDYDGYQRVPEVFRQLEEHQLDPVEFKMQHPNEYYKKWRAIASPVKHDYPVPTNDPLDYPVLTNDSLNYPLPVVSSQTFIDVVLSMLLKTVSWVRKQLSESDLFGLKEPFNFQKSLNITKKFLCYT